MRIYSDMTKGGENTMKMMKSLSVLSLVVLCLAIATVAGAAITQVGTGGDYNGYGYNGYGYWNGYANSCAAGSNCTGAQYGLVPYMGPTREYCTRYRPGCWVPVTVKIPAHWESRPVWVQDQPLTLYRKVEGGWQWKAPNGMWYDMPSQIQPGGYPGGYPGGCSGGYSGGYSGGCSGGYSGAYPGGQFDPYGVWRSAP
jgi:hypothetical protein